MSLDSCTILSWIKSYRGEEKHSIRPLCFSFQYEGIIYRKKIQTNSCVQKVMLTIEFWQTQSSTWIRCLLRTNLRRKRCIGCIIVLNVIYVLISLIVPIHNAQMSVKVNFTATVLNVNIVLNEPGFVLHSYKTLLYKTKHISH